jgi:ferritin-like metal-binding protein YciE
MKNSEKIIEKKAVESKNNDLIVNPNKDAASNLSDLFIDSLKDIYWAENALVNALPKMIANATAPSLISAIKDHHAVTKNQLIRLVKVFELLGEKAEGKKCEAMAGLLKEGDSIIEETIPGAVRDAGIIAASQKIEHYEIATYGTLVAFAKALGENDVAKLLTQTLAEEKEADSVLNDVALNAVNSLATA